MFSGVWRVENCDFTTVEMLVSSIPAEKSCFDDVFMRT